VFAHIECESSGATLQMLLRLPTGSHMLRSCDPAVGSADAQLVVPQPGMAYVEVWSDTASAAARYRLQVWTEGGSPSCGADAFEPNDDLDFVRPDGVYYTGIRALTTKQRPAMQVQAQLDAVEDPRDVYRVFVPRDGTLRAVASSPEADVDLALWKEGAVSVKQRLVGSDRLARAATSGPREAFRYRNNGPGRFAYVAVTLPKGSRAAAYDLRISTGP